MGQAKARREQIAELKKQKVAKQRHKLALTPVHDIGVLHFKNAAARAQANAAGIDHAAPSDSVPPNLLQQARLKVRTHSWKARPINKPAKPIEPVVLVVGRKLSPQEFAIHVEALANLVPQNVDSHRCSHDPAIRAVNVARGFRSPSIKAKNWRSTSLVEQTSIRAGESPERTFEPSARGKKKLDAKQEAKALTYLERLMRDNQEKAIEARGDDKKQRWFIGKVMAAMAGEISHEWLETIVPEKLTAFYCDRFKYLHATERRRQTAQEFGVAAIMVDGQVYAFKEAA